MSVKTEKTQLYLRSGQLDRLHRIKGDNRGCTISGMVCEAIDLYLAEQDRTLQKGRAKRTKAHVASA